MPRAARARCRGTGQALKLGHKNDGEGGWKRDVFVNWFRIPLPVAAVQLTQQDLDKIRLLGPLTESYDTVYSKLKKRQVSCGSSLKICTVASADAVRRVRRVAGGTIDMCSTCTNVKSQTPTPFPALWSGPGVTLSLCLSLSSYYLQLHTRY